MKGTISKEQLLGSGNNLEEGTTEVSTQEVYYTTEHVLTPEEKSFLLHAERGDCATIRSLLEQFHPDQPEILDINCVDPLDRSALIAAIENENIELIRLLLEGGIKVKDALLHSIKEEYVEAVELLLQWEEENHVPGEPYSWEAVDRSCSAFTPDITPLILAAHRNHYEILKILLDRGATLPMPHDVRFVCNRAVANSTLGESASSFIAVRCLGGRVLNEAVRTAKMDSVVVDQMRCGCDDCVESSERDSLRHSQARINAYRALTAPSLIALSSPDPVLTAFQLSWELRRLSRMETEFRAEYNELRMQCQEFATALLDHARTSNELEIMLNFNPGDADVWDPGERQTLDRLKLAIKYKQKMFVAHPNVQQLLGAIWYEGLPGFRRKGMVGQLMQVAQLGAMFPVYSTIYMLAPNSNMGRFMKKPFVKFICFSSSYAVFLTLLCLASQRAEYLVLEWIGSPWTLSILDGWKRKERGALPGFIEFSVILYVTSLIWAEIRSLWNDGLLDYISDLWNIVDFITNIFYVAWVSLRFTSWYIVQRDAGRGLDPWYPRESWDPYDPMLLSEGTFAAGMIFSFLKLVHLFSINPHLGPLQVSLGRMIIDIIKFFFIYTLVLFAFGCGMNQLMWYYADLEKNKCYHLPSGLPDFDNQEKACSIWRRYANLFETSQSLFWASFGLVDLTTFDLTGIKSFTRFWALLMFGSYSVINVIVLLNMLIAMMSNSYQIISERSDVEWKFARTNLWMSYFEEGDTVPPPFNLIPTPKLFFRILKCKPKRSTTSIMKKSREKAQTRYENVMRQLIRRYVTAEQRKRDDFGITEDDVMEIRQDISTLRYELIDILNKNGMQTPRVNPNDMQIPGKKGRVMERRLLKDFHIGIVEGIVNEVISSEKETKDVFSQIAKAIGKRGGSTSKGKNWNELVRKNTVKGDPIGTRSEALLRRSRQSLRQHIIEEMDQHITDVEKLVAYNPKLSEVTPTTRVAYAKFMKSKFKSDYYIGEERALRGSIKSSSSRTIDDPKTESSERATPVLQLKSKSDEEKDSIVDDVDVKKDIDSIKIDEKDFRSRTPIQEHPNEDLYIDTLSEHHDIEVQADVQSAPEGDSKYMSDRDSESTSAVTRPLKSPSKESSEVISSSSEHSASLPSSPLGTVTGPIPTVQEPVSAVTEPLKSPSKESSEVKSLSPEHSASLPSSPLRTMPCPIPTIQEPTPSSSPHTSPSHHSSPHIQPPSRSPSPSFQSPSGRGTSKATGKQISGWL